jgi:hypothetical protein
MWREAHDRLLTFLPPPDDRAHAQTERVSQELRRALTVGIAAAVLAPLVGVPLVGLAMPSDQASPRSATDVRACVDRDTGVMRIPRSTRPCYQRERELIWAIAGPAGPSGAPGGFGAYGSFLDLQTQPKTSPGNPIPIRFRTTDLSSGVSIVDDTKITVAQSGVYNIAFSAQLTKTDSGTDIIYLWLQANGHDVPDSNTGLVLTGSGAKQVAAWNFVIPLDAGQYATLVWASLDSAARILYEDDTTTPYGPAIPSMILTVNQVG